MEPNSATISLGAEDVVERRHTNVSFLDLPRELREMIYGYIPHNSGIFTYDTLSRTKKPLLLPASLARRPREDTFEAIYGNPGIAFGSGDHSFAILSTCRTVHQEAKPIIYAATPLGIWRPMFDLGSAVDYPDFVAKAFSSLPMQASKHIRTLQVQGELWQRNMGPFLSTALAKFPHLKVLEIGVDPYYDMKRRAHWFDDRAVLRQVWPAISTLHLVAQRLSIVKLTISPPSDRVCIVADGNEDWFYLSDAAYQRYIWLHLQLSVIRYELSIYGALVHGDAKDGMEFFMDLLLQRRDSFKKRDLFGLFQGRMSVYWCQDGTVDFKLEEEREWLRNITGRCFEVNEKERRVDVFSEENAEVKWCNFSYELRPRGMAEC